MFEEFRDSWEEWRNKVNDALSGGGGSSEVHSIKVGSTVYNPVLGVVSLPAYPSKVSDLTNDAGYTNNVGTVTGAKIGATDYSPVNGVLEFPAYPSKVSDLTNDAGYTTNVGTVTGAKIGDTSYSPANGVLEFPAYPSKVSDLTNDAGYTTNVGTVTGAKIGDTSYSPANGVLEFPAYPSKVSELTNDAGYTTNTGTVTSVKVGETGYAPIAGVVSLPQFVSDPDYVHIDVDDELSTTSDNPVENGVITTALNNEVATRAALGAHNLLGIEEWCEQAGTTYTKSGNAYTIASVNALEDTPFVFSDTDVDVVVTGTIANGTAVGVIIKLLDSSDQVVANSSPNTDFELRGSGCKVVLDFMASDGTAVLTNAMVSLQSDKDSNYQPYGKTNVKLTEGLSAVTQNFNEYINMCGVKNLWDIDKYHAMSYEQGASSTYSDGVITISCPAGGGGYFTHQNMKSWFDDYKGMPLVMTFDVKAEADNVAALMGMVGALQEVTLGTTYQTIVVPISDVIYLNHIIIETSDSANAHTLTATNFMLTLASWYEEDSDFEPFAMTNQQLTDIAQQTQGNYVLKDTSIDISVTADGVKTFGTLLDELNSAFRNYLANHENEFLRITSGRFHDTSSYYRPYGIAKFNYYNKNTNAYNVDFELIAMDGSGNMVLYSVVIATNSANAVIGYRQGSTFTNRKTEVATSGLQLIIIADSYLKIS